MAVALFLMASKKRSPGDSTRYDPRVDAREELDLVRHVCHLGRASMRELWGKRKKIAKLGAQRFSAGAGLFGELRGSEKQVDDLARNRESMILSWIWSVEIFGLR